MAGSCLLRSTSTGAVTVPQFMDALHRTWLESRRFRPGTTSVMPRRLGLAVSGGADSMALAYLCRQWEIQKQQPQQKQNQHRIRDVHHRDEASVTAFIVDHKARQESTQEANTVAHWLRELGITAQILPLDWNGVSVSAFETHARRLRFQALGEACRDRGIEALLMGHHQDDNVETTIWRLCSGARGAGLAGISDVARIPECHGLYGVSGSGETVTVRSGDFLESQHKHPEQQRSNQNSVLVSTGGVLVCRPLLSFPKSNLIATCYENNVPFVSDPTNFDPTLTPRNAIRSLLLSNSLPRALQNSSILSLIGKCQNLIHDSHRLSDDIIKSQCRLLDMSIASGSLTVQFNSPAPPSPNTSSQEHHQRQEISTQRLHELQSLTLRRITELISPFPDNHFPLSSFTGFTNRVFTFPSTISDPNLDPVTGREIDEERTQKERKPFTLGGVLFHPLSSSKTTTTKSTTTTTTALNAINHSITDRPAATWLLTRQPYMRRRDPILRFNLPSLNNPASATANPKQQFRIPWTLWDNRFWIRASLTPKRDSLRKEEEEESSSARTHTRTLTATNGEGTYPQDESKAQLILRPLRQSDLSALRRLHTKNAKTKDRDPNQNPNSIYGCEAESTFNVAAFFAKLDREAPGQTRFTMLVLALAESGAGGAGEGVVDVPLALPTIDLMFPGLESRGWTITWGWKYKMVDLELLKLMGSV